MSIPSVLERLRLDPKFVSNVVAWERLPEREARYAPLPEPLDPLLARALRARGLAPLYTHQAEAVSAALRGEHVVIVTGTASGKTLCYNLPVLQALLADAGARALYLFPTKALAQDQANELSEFEREIRNCELRIRNGGSETPEGSLQDEVNDSQFATRNSQLAIRIYDGDTPQGRRATIRREASVLITNPDMLHTGILPHHTRWAEFFEGLRFVVLDELHTYRGVFGSHVANVLRRLKRLCRFYGSSPQFICASATIANPQELAEKLIEAPVTLVAGDGAPRAEKHFILYNPPVLDPALGLRRAYTLEAKNIAGRFLAAGAQTVVFARARSTAELLLGYLRDEVAKQGGSPQTVRGYRGGYLPGERREIERGLRDGTVRGVVATNALELGVDIGQLGAAVIAGYPGTIASVWQQAGRAGRRHETSTAVFVASGAPLDQYIAAHPRYLFESSPEHALINPDNLAILVKHLRCAAFELPLEAGEPFGTFGDVTDLLDVLREAGELHRSSGGGTYRWVADTYPADGTSLRTSSDETVVIQDVTEGRPTAIGEVDAISAPVIVHAGAVYVHEGRQFIVENLNWAQHLATVRSTEVDYYTQASEAVDVSVLETFEEETSLSDRVRRAHGRVLVTAQATSYRKIKRYTHETLGYGPIDLPAREMETTAFWLWLTPELVRALQAAGVLIAPNDYGPDWPAMRDAARARDGYRCRQCGTPERRQHDVHHIRPFREFGYIPGENDNYLAANALDNVVTLCPACHHRAEAARGTRTALGGLTHALGNLAPLHLMCDPRDLGLTAELRGAETRLPTITIYDRVPDGIGFSERLFELYPELVQGALDLASSCKCRDGCPACVGPTAEGAEIKEKTRQLAEMMVRL